MRSLLGAECMRIIAAYLVSSKWDMITYSEFKKELKSFFEYPKNHAVANRKKKFI